MQLLVLPPLFRLWYNSRRLCHPFYPFYPFYPSPRWTSATTISHSSPLKITLLVRLSTLLIVSASVILQWSTRPAPWPDSDSRPASRSLIDISTWSPLQRSHSSVTDIPLGESQIHLSSSLRYQSLVVFETFPYCAGSDAEVAVVPVETPFSQSVSHLTRRSVEFKTSRMLLT